MRIQYLIQERASGNTLTQRNFIVGVPIDDDMKRQVITELADLGQIEKDRKEKGN